MSKIIQNAFNWDINMTQVLNHRGEVIPGYNEITRSDNDKSIVIAKESYVPMTTQQFTETAEAVAEQIGAKVNEYHDWETGHNTENMGSAKPVITAQIALSDPLEIGGSKIDGYLTIGVGFDTQRSFFIGHTNKYLRCSNEFSSIIKDFTSRLTKNNMVRVKDIVASIKLYKQYEEELYKSFKKFEKVEVDEKVIQMCLDRLANLTVEEMAMSKEQRLEELSTQKLNKMDDILASIRPEMSELGDNMWGLFNGCTFYSSHVMNHRGHKGMGMLFGSGAKFNKIAYDFGLELLENS